MLRYKFDSVYEYSDKHSRHVRHVCYRADQYIFMHFMLETIGHIMFK